MKKSFSYEYSNNQATHNSEIQAFKTEEETIDLVALWRGLMLKWPWIVVSSLIGFILGFLYYQSKPDIYETSASLSTVGNMNMGNLRDNMVTSSPLPEGVLKEALQGPVVLGEIIKIVNNSKLPAKTKNQMTSDLQKDLQNRTLSSISLKSNINLAGNGMYTIVGKGLTPSSAVTLTNATAKALLNWDKNRAARGIKSAKTKLESQLVAISRQLSQKNLTTSQKEVLRSSRKDIENKITQTAIQIEGATGFLEPIAPAVKPINPVAPRPLRKATLVALLIAFVAIGIISLRIIMDRTIRNEDDLINFEIPVLGNIPLISKKDIAQSGVIGASQSGTLYEALGFLKVQLFSLLSQKRKGIIMISSVAPTEGKSSLTASIAANLASEGKRVLVIDADMRRGTQRFVWSRVNPDEEWTQLSGIGGVRSLREFLENPSDNVQVLRPQKNVNVLPSGPGLQDSLILLNQTDLAPYLKVWQARYDIILIDSPPVLALADAISIGQYADRTVLVVEANKTNVAGVKQSLRRLDGAGIRVHGFIVNKLKAKTRSGYNYNYDYGLLTKA